MIRRASLGHNRARRQLAATKPLGAPNQHDGEPRRRESGCLCICAQAFVELYKKPLGTALKGSLCRKLRQPSLAATWRFLREMRMKDTEEELLLMSPTEREAMRSLTASAAG